MARIRQTCLCLLLAMLCAGAGAAQDKDFPGVEKLMTSEEFAEAGLDKLTRAERKALNAWGRKLESITSGEKAKVIELNTG